MLSLCKKKKKYPHQQSEWKLQVEEDVTTTVALLGAKGSP